MMRRALHRFGAWLALVTADKPRMVRIDMRGSVFDGNTVRDLIAEINKQLGPTQ